MIGKAKALTLALAALCALSAVSASAASAAEFHIADMGAVSGHGTQIAGSSTVFSIPEGELKCPTALFKVQALTDNLNQVQETTGQTARISVEEGETQTLACTFAGFQAIVHMNGCDFKIHAGPPVQATILCPAGQQITVTVTLTQVTKCTIHIPEQEELQGFSITNGAQDIDFTAAVQGIKYQTTQGEGVGKCTATTTGTDGKFNGKVTVQGTAKESASTIQYASPPPPREFHIAGMGTAMGDGTQIAGSATVFSIPEGELKCPTAIFNVHQLQNSSSAEVETTGQTATVKVEEPITQAHPSDKETITCTFAGFATLIHMNGCDFRLHAGTSIQATVICPAGKQVVVTVTLVGITKCTIHIPEQADLGGITITNNANDIDLTAAVQGIKYQTTAGSGVGACTATTDKTDGKFNGKVTVQGTAGGVASKLQYS